MAFKNQISGSLQCCCCLFQKKSFSKPQQVTKLLKVQQARGPDGNTAGMGRRRQAISLPGGPQEQLMPAKEETAWQRPWGQTNAGTTQCPHGTTWSHTYDLRLLALSSNQKPDPNSCPAIQVTLHRSQVQPSSPGLPLWQGEKGTFLST